MIKCGNELEKPKISVIIPVLNEALIIGDVVSQTMSALDNIGLPYEVIVVDDGSSDLTGDMAREKGAKVISSSITVGKGRALRMGIAEAQGDFVVTLDGDGTQDPKEIKRLIAPLVKGKDVVFGTRFAKGSNVKPHSLTRINFFGMRLFNLTIQFLMGKAITDIASSFRAFKIDALKALKLTSDDSLIEAEMTVKVLNSEFDYEEVPITYSNRRSYRLTKSNIFIEGLRVTTIILRSFYFPSSLKGE